MRNPAKHINTKYCKFFTLLLSMVLLISLFPASTSQARSFRKRFRYGNRAKVTRDKTGTISRKDLKKAGAGSCKNLMIVAHPDDEMLWGGSHLIKEKWFVVCITEGYNKTRATEFEKVLKKTKDKGIILNYTDVYQELRYDWSKSKRGIRKDIRTILKYKHWNMIATHNPEGEYGHIQHIMTNRIVTKKCRKKPSLFRNLYYFGRYYSEEGTPEDEPKIDSRVLKTKKKILKIYKSQKTACMQTFKHTWPYENWQSAYTLYKTGSIKTAYPNIHKRKLQVKKKQRLQKIARKKRALRKRAARKGAPHKKYSIKCIIKKKHLGKNLRLPHEEMPDKEQTTPNE